MVIHSLGGLSLVRTYVGRRAASSLLVARTTEDVNTADTNQGVNETEQTSLLEAVAALCGLAGTTSRTGSRH